jgi:FkbM family methyltransferase
MGNVKNSMLSRLVNILRQSIQSFLGKFGLGLVRLSPRPQSSFPRGSMRGAMQALTKQCIPIQTIVDIGASDGHWSEMTMEFYPQINYLLIEAQTVHQEKLDAFVIDHPNAQYCLAAAGDKAGLIFFDAGNPFGGQASYKPYAQNNIEVKVTTVDAEVAQRGLSGPFLLKLDTHGFEVPILTGASEVLRNAQVIVIECYVQCLTENSLTFSQMCSHLDTFGFRCIDAVDLEWRPFDDTLWQMDLVFIRKDRVEFAYHDYV